jgi:nucleotide-binding universal stress UspA family protein
MGDSEQSPVLVAIGDEGEIDAALDAAAAEAERRRCVVRVVHVVARASAARTGRLRLALAEERLRERLPVPARVETQLATGAVVPCLVDLSREASLVVLQRQPHPRASLATLAHLSGVAARASCPVLCAPPHWRRDILDARPVGVGVEPDPAPAVVRAALGVARGTTGRLRLICAPDAEITGPDRDGESWATRVEAVVRGRLGSVLEEQPDVDVDVAPWHGRPVNALLAESRDCSLLVVGRHHHLLPSGSHLGSKVPHLLREVGCLVLVVDPVGPADDPSANRGPDRARQRAREKGKR